MRRKLGETAVSMKVMVYGKEGTRKSNTAIQFSTLKNRAGKDFRVLLIDTEFKSIEGFNEAWIESKNVNFDNICEIRTRDLSLITLLADKFTKGEPIPVTDENGKVLQNEYELDADGNPFVADVLIMDSISVINDLLIEGRQELAKKRTNIKIIRDGLFGDEKELALENSGLQFLDYAKLKSKALKMVRDLQAVTGKHVVYVARSKDAKENKLVNGKMEVVDLGYELMDATSFKFLPYEVNLIVHTIKNNGIVEHHIEKDSTGVNHQGDIMYDFDLSSYGDFINNIYRNQLLKSQSYEKTLDIATTFAEDAEEADNDIKLKIYKLIIQQCRASAELGNLTKKYCKEHGISLADPNVVALSDLVELKKLLNL